MEADTGNRQWRSIQTPLAFLVSAMHFNPTFSFVSFSFLCFLLNVKQNLTRLRGIIRAVRLWLLCLCSSLGLEGHTYKADWALKVIHIS